MHHDKHTVFSHAQIEFYNVGSGFYAMLDCSDGIFRSISPVATVGGYHYAAVGRRVESVYQAVYSVGSMAAYRQDAEHE